MNVDWIDECTVVGPLWWQQAVAEALTGLSNVRFRDGEVAVLRADGCPDYAIELVRRLLGLYVEIIVQPCWLTGCPDGWLTIEAEPLPK